MKHVSDCRRQTRAKQTYNLIGSRGQHEQRPLVVPPLPHSVTPPTALSRDGRFIPCRVNPWQRCRCVQRLPNAFQKRRLQQAHGKSNLFAAIGYCCCCSWGCHCRSCCCCFLCWCRFTHSAEMFKLRCSFHYLFLYDANVLNSSVLT